MNYIQGLSTQTKLFFYSLGFGVILGLLYDIFRFFRLALSGGKVLTIFFDLAYSLFSTVLIFCFLLVFDFGRTRFYTFFGMLFGFVVFYFSFGAVSVRIGAVISRFSCKTKSLIGKIFRKIFAK